MERPWLKFYGRDWRNDQELYLCSISARGLWIAMLTLMSEGVPYGHLSTIAGPITPKRLSESEHISTSQCQRLLTELEEQAVFSRNKDGLIFCRRMVRDEEIRLKRAAGGIKSIEHPNTPKGTLNGLAEGSYEKHPTRALRALASSLSPGFEVKKSEDGPKSILDDFEEFRLACSEVELPFSDADLVFARIEWFRLDFEQKLCAIKGLHLRKQCGEYDDPGFRPLPQNYLSKRMWERPLRIKQTTQSKMDAKWANI